MKKFRRLLELRILETAELIPFKFDTQGNEIVEHPKCDFY